MCRKPGKLPVLDWLVVGGGIHGTHLSHVLVNRLGHASDAVRVLDPEARPLAAWHRCTSACGMSYLRSPQAHHLGLRSAELREFARENDRGREFMPPYRRPSLALFNEHARQVVQRGSLAELRERATACHLERVTHGYRVHTDREPLYARHVLLALGQPAIARPDWARELVHVFDAGFGERAAAGAYADKRVAVIGAGATGAQLALKLAEQARQVHLVAPIGIRETHFDSNPCYLGPRCLDSFSRMDISGRRRILNTVRNIGTVPAEIRQQILDCSNVRVWNGRVRASEDGGLRLADGRNVPASEAILATGYERLPPGGTLVKDAVQRLNLPVSPLGWPLLQPDLQWGDGLFVCGRLGELELGPAAANLSGARMAGKRLQLWHTRRKRA